ncbi:MAG: N-6 DNA methylase [Chloroflexota bacterium]
MLDTDTKRRIDTARDILVGKVPDPKSQVEQITIALIYKFMDDMDAESEELGGKRKFFTGDFARYGWAKLMSPGLGGHEMLGLYAEGLVKMPENAGVPPLFRDIFKNAYLPYRDPETLKAFLKVIDEFSYDHSERLGDAFEYLLSVLGSQGDAGQFRTPRHIIDFIVAVVAPKKGESILDPACGTAGFLISSYKHILRANTDAKGQSTLTPDEKGRLAQNLRGYDISPDMVRLSLVNLYLHGFTDPHVYEYDTLTSEERWNEFADVIFANPPFMSPKGGIKPHHRFSVQAKRSEVLFVDYIAEHLTPSGRAGIIVPEGIIFQSQTAYRDLRKKLVEECLVAVVSLPAGVFNPYAGVKTSVLILDKSLARHNDSIAFFKIENDGYGLGAQRRAIEKNDLPQALAELDSYLESLRNQRLTGDLHLALGQVVLKDKVVANGGYNLSGERYRKNGVRASLFPQVRIADVCIVNPRKSEIDGMDRSTAVSFVPMADLNENAISFQPTAVKLLADVSNSYTYFRNGDVLVAKVTPCFENGKAGVVRGLLHGIGFGSSEFYVLRPANRTLPEWIYYCVTDPRFRDGAIAQMTGTGGLQRVPRAYVEEFEIPLPPLEVQQEIVAEIEGYQKVINGARAVVDNYRPHIPIHPDWPMVKLGDICTLGGSITTAVNLALPYFGADSIESNTGKVLKTQTARSQGVRGPAYEFGGQRLLYSKIRPYLNKLTVVDLDGYCSSDMYPLLPDPTRVHVTYLATFMLSDTFNERIRRYYERANIPKINRLQLFDTEIPLPSLATQQTVVAEIEAEQALVAANRELIERFEKKIQATIARVWGDDLKLAVEA